MLWVVAAGCAARHFSQRPVHFEAGSAMYYAVQRRGAHVPYPSSRAVGGGVPESEGFRAGAPPATGLTPEDVRALVRTNCTYERLAVEATVERNRDKALCALLLNPVRHTYDQAVQVLDKAWQM